MTESIIEKLQQISDAITGALDQPDSPASYDAMVLRLMVAKELVPEIEAALTRMALPKAEVKDVLIRDGSTVMVAGWPFQKKVVIVSNVEADDADTIKKALTEGVGV